MKPILFVLSFLAIQLMCNNDATAQPKKLWSKIFGGNLSDICNQISQYNDTMLISVGKSSSTNVGGNKGVDDYMVCQFKPDGKLIRLKTFGGPSSDQANAFAILPNGNIVIGGFNNGKGGDVANNYLLSDAWVVSYNPNTGAKVWEKNYGGSNNDLISDIFYLETNKIIFAGYTKSIDKDVVSAPTKGGNDVFIASIDTIGGLIKAVTFGGTKDETAKRILRADASGGQMLILGESESNDMDFNGLNHGKKDIFILKVNRNLNKIFLTSYGGPGNDLFADAINLGDNGIIVFSTVDSTGGQVNALKGGKDIMMAKLDKNGVFQWSKNIGGINDESAIKAQLTANNEIILLGNSSSRDQDISANYGGSDVLVMKLDTSGNILWNKNYGGTGGENAGALCLGNDGSIYFVAQTFSKNIDLDTTNKFSPDFWTVKLFDCVTKETSINLQACVGDTLVFGSTKFYVGKDTANMLLVNATVNGCDSVTHVAVQFFNKTKELITDSLCNEATMTINNVIFDKTHPSDSFHLTNFLGCDSLLAVKFYFSTPLKVIDTVITKDNGTSIGCIHIIVDGGCKPYTYDWSNGATSSLNCNITAGTYKVTVNDCHNCSNEFQFVVGTTVSTQSENANKPEIKYLDDRILIKLGSENILSLSIYSMTGQFVTKLNPKSNEVSIQRNSLSKGVFVGELTGESGIRHQFLISN